MASSTQRCRCNTDGLPVRLVNTDGSLRPAAYVRVERVSFLLAWAKPCITHPRSLDLGFRNSGSSLEVANAKVALAPRDLRQRLFPSAAEICTLDAPSRRCPLRTIKIASDLPADFTSAAPLCHVWRCCERKERKRKRRWGGFVYVLFAAR